MGSKRILIIKGPTYFSQGDETAFFTWLQSIPGVKAVGGQGYDLYIYLKRAASITTLRELSALLSRYKMPTTGLIQFKTGKNAVWFDTNPKAPRSKS